MLPLEDIEEISLIAFMLSSPNFSKWNDIKEKLTEWIVNEKYDNTFNLRDVFTCACEYDCKRIVSHFINSSHFEKYINHCFKTVCINNSKRCFELFKGKNIDLEEGFKIACYFGSSDVVEMILKNYEVSSLKEGIFYAKKMRRDNVMKIICN